MTAALGRSALERRPNRGHNRTLHKGIESRRLPAILDEKLCKGSDSSDESLFEVCARIDAFAARGQEDIV
jgi:hypothetical protein